MCVYVQTQIFFTAISGTESMQKKSSTEEKKRCLLKVNSPNWAPNATQRESLFFASIFSCVSFWSFPIQEKGTAHFWNPLLPKEGGGTIRTCSKSEQQFERRRRRLVFPEKKTFMAFRFEKSTKQAPRFPGQITS